MITPAGKECKHFHGDYFRGRNIERCRLLDAYRLQWEPSLCNECPVPSILAANACEHQTLAPSIHKPLFFMKPTVQIKAECSLSQASVEEPRIGCGQCHPLPPVFVVGPE